MRRGQRRLPRARASPSWCSQRRDALALAGAAWEASKAARERNCLSFTQRQDVDFQRNSQQGIHTLTPLKKSGQIVFLFITS